MKQYIITIEDENKAKQLLAFLGDLSYVKIQESQEKPTIESGRKPPLIMDNPFSVDNATKFCKDELNKRQ
ncbi:MAG: hypothetical protein FWB93_03205 [Oscillospiraceae bacterium]|nr:hypothetical protein [Oscillospiraceae bacterium]